MPDNTSLFFIFTGLDSDCAEFNIQTKSVINAFNKEFDVKCIPTTSADIANFESALKIRESEARPLINSRPPAEKIIVMAHSFGAILALKLIEQMELNDRIILILIDPSTGNHPLIQSQPALTRILTNLTFKTTCPTLVFTFFQNALLKSKIADTTRLTKLTNHTRIQTLQSFLNRYTQKFDMFNRLLGDNPNVNTVVLAEPPGVKYENPHFIHVNDPLAIITMTRKFLGLNGLVRSSTGGQRKTLKKIRSPSTH